MIVHHVPGITAERYVTIQQQVAMATTKHQLPCFQMIVHHVPGIPAERYVIIKQQVANGYHKSTSYLVSR